MNVLSVPMTVKKVPYIQIVIAIKSAVMIMTITNASNVQKEQLEFFRIVLATICHFSMVKHVQKSVQMDQRDRMEVVLAMRQKFMSKKLTNVMHVRTKGNYFIS